MYLNVRAAFALTLPVGLVLLGIGSAVVGHRPTVPSLGFKKATEPAHIAGARPLRSTPQAAEAGEPARLNSDAASMQQDIARRRIGPNSEGKALAREPYDTPLWSRQYAALSEDEPAVSSAGREEIPAASNQHPWHASPTQYVALDAPANSPAASAPGAPSSPALNPPALNPPALNPPVASAPSSPVQLPQASSTPDMRRLPPPLDLAALAPVSQQAQLRVDEAFRFARRGAMYAARAELIQALRMIAQAVDTLEQSNRRSQAMAAGFHAMKEAEDFFVSSDTLEHDLDVEGIVLGHRTPVLKGQPLAGFSSLAALQQYYSYAQQQFAIAAAGTQAGSRALYGLGKVHMTLSRESTDDRSHQTPKAMAFFQASMQADQRNHLAANELGVLLAQYGQLAEAKRMLVHSVSVQSHAEGWQNLAVVHSRMGEQDLARRATHERELLLARSAGGNGSDRPVQWVGPQEFNAVGGNDDLATAPAMRGSAPTRSASTSRAASTSTKPSTTTRR
jgi:tetratricopeptide (TPR) repeat protein